MKEIGDETERLFFGILPHDARYSWRLVSSCTTCIMRFHAAAEKYCLVATKNRARLVAQNRYRYAVRASSHSPLFIRAVRLSRQPVEIEKRARQSAILAPILRPGICRSRQSPSQWRIGLRDGRPMTVGCLGHREYTALLIAWSRSIAIQTGKDNRPRNTRLGPCHSALNGYRCVCARDLSCRTVTCRAPLRKSTRDRIGGRT